MSDTNQARAVHTQSLSFREGLIIIHTHIYILRINVKFHIEITVVLFYLTSVNFIREKVKIR